MKESISSSAIDHDTDVINYVLIIAHPDDESMFFLPTIYNILQQSSTRIIRMLILCLSNGNYDNLGATRERELLAAAEIISGSNRSIDVTILNDENLLDGPNESWSAEIIEKQIKGFIATEKIENESLVLLTFDEDGVSGHINHIHTYNGVILFFSRYENDNINLCTNENENLANAGDANNLELWTLKSVRNPFIKYIPLSTFILMWIGWLLDLSSGIRKKDEDVKRFVMIHPTLVWSSMKAHRSQFVWYRRLFVVFSRYSYVNDLKRYKRNDVHSGNLKKYD